MRIWQKVGFQGSVGFKVYRCGADPFSKCSCIIEVLNIMWLHLGSGGKPNV